MGRWNWREWFIAAPASQPPGRHYIVDIGQAFEIDRDYASTGESEGWLEFTGYRMGTDDIVEYHYRHI